jgi:hypothetical protein
MEFKILLPEHLTTEGFEPFKKKLGKPIDPHELDHALEFIATHFKKRKGYNKIQSSFALSKLMCRRMDKHNFISNGGLIAAMLMSGYKCKLSTTNKLNCYFNVCRVDEKKIKQEINNQ